MRISLSLSIAVMLAQPGPASAKPSLERAAKALCHGDTTGVDLGEMLSQARGRAIAPLMRAAVSLEADDECDQDPLTMLVDLLCEAQGAVAGNRVTPAFAPVRAALTSGDPRRESAALDVLASLNGVTDFNPGIESVEPSGGGPRCEYKKPIVAAAVTPLARLLERTRGARRAEALNVIAQLDLQEMGAPFVPPLIPPPRQSRLTRAGGPDADNHRSARGGRGAAPWPVAGGGDRARRGVNLRVRAHGDWRSFRRGGCRFAGAARRRVATDL